LCLSELRKYQIVGSGFEGYTPGTTNLSALLKNGNLIDFGIYFSFVRGM